MKVVYTSVSKLADAKKLGAAIVEGKLAACVSYWKINSTYFWKGKLAEEGEYLLEMKISGRKRIGAGSEKALTAFLEKSHPHELPMICSIDAAGSKKYERWLAGKK